MRPSFKKHTRRYKEMVAPAKTLEGMKKLTKKRRYANRHGLGRQAMSRSRAAHGSLKIAEP
jgi:hypothetical protein